MYVVVYSGGVRYSQCVDTSFAAAISLETICKAINFSFGDVSQSTKYTYTYAEIDFSTSGIQYGGIDGAGSWYYYIYQTTADSAANREDTMSSGSAYPLQVGASFNSFEGIIMEFGIVNSSSATYENALQSYIATKWGTGGCPAINSVENGHGVVATTSTDYYCRIPFENRDCTQSCATG